MRAEKMNELLEFYQMYMEHNKDFYFKYVLFSTQWWVLVIIIIGLWSLWAMLVDKKRIITILLVGLLASLIAIILDDAGLNLMLWDYPYRITYFTSRMDPVNVAIIPISYMLLYQYMRTWKAYVIVLAVLSLFGAFIVEPIFVKFNMYIMIQWKYWYSVPAYILIGIFVKWFVDKLEKRYA